MDCKGFHVKWNSHCRPNVILKFIQCFVKCRNVLQKSQNVMKQYQEVKCKLQRSWNLVDVLGVFKYFAHIGYSCNFLSHVQELSKNSMKLFSQMEKLWHYVSWPQQYLGLGTMWVMLDGLSEDLTTTQ